MQKKMVIVIMRRRRRVMADDNNNNNNKINFYSCKQLKNSDLSRILHVLFDYLFRCLTQKPMS